MTLTNQPTHRLGPLLGGIGVSLAAHATTVACVYLAGWLVGGGEDLEAGGRFAVAVVGFVTLFVGQGLLFSVAVPVGIVSLRRRRNFGIGVLAGYVTGLLVIVALVFWLLLTASQCAVCADVQV